MFERAERRRAQPLLEAMEERPDREPTPPEELTAEEIASEINQHLETYRFVGGRVERGAPPERGCWVNIVNPTRDNLPLIAEHFKIPTDFLTASLDVDETARVEIEDNATLIIVKIPYFDEKMDVLYFTIPIGIILVGNLTLTVCSKPTACRTTSTTGPPHGGRPPLHPAADPAFDPAVPAATSSS